MQDQRKPDPRTDEERQRDHREAQAFMNQLLHSRPNAVRTTRLTTVQELNDGLRRAAGRVQDDETSGDEVA